MRCLKEPFQTTHSELSSIKAEPFINVRIMKKKAILSLPAVSST